MQVPVAQALLDETASKMHILQKTIYADLIAYTTLDGSEIRELMHPTLHGNRNQSLAEAIIPGGACTLLHRHLESEELYHVTAGQGMMTLAGEEFPLIIGDTVLIRPGTPHRIRALGEAPLHILCCCSPAYRHEDTELLEPSPTTNP